jgi:hypothetical protein
VPCQAARPPSATAIARMELVLSAFLRLTWSPTSVAMAAPARHQQQAPAAKPCQKPKRQRPSGPPSHVQGKQWKEQEGNCDLAAQAACSGPLSRWSGAAQLWGRPRVAGCNEVQRGRELLTAQEPEGRPPGWAASCVTISVCRRVGCKWSMLKAARAASSAFAGSGSSHTWHAA